MSNTPDILKKIVARKREEIAERSSKVSIDELKSRLDGASPPRGFVDAIRAKIAAGKAGVISEISGFGKDKKSVWQLPQCTPSNLA